MNKKTLKALLRCAAPKNGWNRHGLEHLHTRDDHTIEASDGKMLLRIKSSHDGSGIVSRKSLEMALKTAKAKSAIHINGSISVDGVDYANNQADIGSCYPPTDDVIPSSPPKHTVSFDAALLARLFTAMVDAGQGHVEIEFRDDNQALTILPKADNDPLSIALVMPLARP
jgi:hypothetical protein